MGFETVEGLITINATLFLQIFQFLIFMFIMDKIMFRPAREVLNERRESLFAKEQEIDRFRKEAVRLKEDLIKIETEAKLKAAQERMRQKEAAIAEAEKFFEQSRAESARIKDEAMANVQDALDKAKLELKEHVVDLADQITEKIAGRRITA
jgi:F-type H+-transporting ATPase subunit b